LKELHEHTADEPAYRVRFVREAEITGRLEHPGVVPVYSLGCGQNGRPYYAMRFIRGHTLEEAIERFHGVSQRGLVSGEGRLKLRQLLNRFVDVCNTIQYAHSRGVLHRDLKPANIMLGEYGETLVVDWGLAKGKSRSTNDVPDESVLRTRLDGDSAPTRLGTVLGTPAYMSPEQAAGRVDSLGPAADIYALGATLYTLLVGQPPFRGKDVEKVLDQVRHGRFPRPRKLLPAVPPRLESICLKAMSRSPDERYNSAADLAEEIEHWLADEPVAAHRESVRERFSRWLRRNKALAQAGSIALVIVALVSSAFAFLADRARRGEEQQRRVATEYFNIALNSMNEMLLAPEDDPLMRDPQFARIRHEVLGTARKFYRQLSKSRGENVDLTLARARAYDKLAYIAIEIEGIQPAYHYQNKCVALLRPLAKTQPDNDQVQYRLAEALSKQALYTDDLGDQIYAEVVIREAITIMERLASKKRLTLPREVSFRKELAELHFYLGSLFLGQYRFDDLADAYEHARALAVAEARQGDDDAGQLLAGIAQNLSVMHHRQNRFEQALAGFGEARRKWEARISAGPSVRAMQNLARAMVGEASVHFARGQLSTAEASCRDIIETLRDDSRDYPDYKDFSVSLLETQTTLGSVYVSRGEFAKAERVLGEAESTCRGLSVDDTSLAASRRVAFWMTRGQLYRRLGKLDLAMDQYRAAKDVLNASRYQIPGFRRCRFVQVQSELASLLCLRGQYEEAKFLLEEALESYQQCGRSESRVPDAMRKEAVARRGLGEVCIRLGKEDEGLGHFQQSREILESLVAEFPEVPWYWQDLAETKWELGKYFYSQGGFNAASAEYAAEADLRDRVVGWQPEVSEYRQQLLDAICRHGLALQRVPDLAGAVDQFEKAIKTDPESPEGYGRVAELLATAPDAKYRDGGRALRAATRACELTDWQDWRQLAAVAAAYAEVGNFEKAQQYNDRSIEFAPEAQRARLHSRGVLYAAGKPYRAG
jgi:serine/threonine-protein kinase